MAEKTNKVDDVKIKAKNGKRKNSESEDLGGSSKIAKTNSEPEYAAGKLSFDPKPIIAKYYRLKAQETLSELINSTDTDSDAETTLKKLKYYVIMAKTKAKIAGIPCYLEKIDLSPN